MIRSQVEFLRTGWNGPCGVAIACGIYLMKQDNLSLTGVERHFDEHEIIVSKTDLKGRITYANDTFLRVAGYRERDILGQPHSIIRHPDMPRCVFALLWQTIEAGREIFAYVINANEVM